MKKIYLYVVLILSLSKVSYSQLLADFESSATAPVLSGNQAAIVTNPDAYGNGSSKVAYYRKASGNWQAVSFTFLSAMNTGQSDQLTFKLRSSTQGRVFVKLVKGTTTILENWAPEYTFRPQAAKWTICTLNTSSIKNMEFDRIEVNAAVDNEAVADVYLDDIKLVNSQSPNGEPIANVTVSSYQITAGESIQFDASLSTDPDGTIVSYAWEFGDGQIASAVLVDHTYTENGIYAASLTLTDNEGKKSYWKKNINVLPTNGRLSRITFPSSGVNVHEKAEGIFLVKGNVTNVYDPDEIKVDAIITKPDATTITVPCFYYEKATYTPMGDQWTKNEGAGYWMLRFSSPQMGSHQVKLRLTDASGTETSAAYPVVIHEGDKKGYIKIDADNKQYYRHTSGEPFYPLGINVAWNSTTSYATTLTNLGKGGANLVRYWQVPFDKQGLEWKNGSGFYKGLGVYSQEAAAEQDSMFSLCEKTNTYLQVTLFQHGMFSETVNSNWGDNPYNSVNGGPLTKAEQYFYNTDAKARTKKLLRYIVARWGYSQNLFAWELFNEVNFTGAHPNQSSLWYPAVKTWHDEMGQYLKLLDAFDHPVTTSSDETHLQDMDKLTGLDVVQYHLYNTSLLSTQITKDKDLLKKMTRTGVVNGEYGLDVNTADVPFDVQRISIWTGIMTQVPHLMWKWENYITASWSDLFKIPSQYLQGEDFVAQGKLTDWVFTVDYGTSKLQSAGFYSDKNFYAIIYDNDNRNNLSKVTADFSVMPAGNYSFTFYNVLTGSTTQDEVAVYPSHTKVELPVFSKAVAIKAKFISALPETITGIRTELQAGKMVPYPNPTNGVIHFAVPESLNGEVMVSLCDVTGREVKCNLDERKEGNQVTVQLKDIPDGIYFLKVTMNNDSCFRKIMYISK